MDLQEVSSLATRVTISVTALVSTTVGLCRVQHQGPHGYWDMPCNTDPAGHLDSTELFDNHRQTPSISDSSAVPQESQLSPSVELLQAH